jgi:hypothetical protein
MAIYRTSCHRVSVVLSTVVLVLASSPLFLSQIPCAWAATDAANKAVTRAIPNFFGIVGPPCFVRPAG